MNQEQKPPQIFLRFFRWYCHPRLRNSIEGDLMELYSERLVGLGKGRADLRFIIDVVQLCRPGIIGIDNKNQSINHYAMFINYLKIGWRNLLRQRMYSLIKIGGFAIGIAACLLHQSNVDETGKQSSFRMRPVDVQ